VRILLAAGVWACLTGACRREPVPGTPSAPTATATADARGTTMGDSNDKPNAAGEISLSVTARADVPAALVAFDGAGELVTADERRAMRWRAQAPGAPIDLAAWAPVKSLAVAADGTVLAGAARIAADGSIGGDAAAFRAAFGAAGKASALWTLTAAAWRGDGAELWLSTRRQPPTSKGPAPAGPRARFLVLGSGLAIARELDGGGVPWSRIIAAPTWTATVGAGLQLWPASGGAAVELAKAPPGAIAASGDGRVVAAGTLGRATAWSAPDGRELASWDVPGQAVTAIAASRDGALIATADDAGAIRLWRLDGGAAREVASAEADPMVTGLAFSPDDRRLAAVSPMPPGGTTLLAIRTR